MPAVPLDPVACIAQNLQQERLIRGLTLAGLGAFIVLSLRRERRQNRAVRPTATGTR